MMDIEALVDALLARRGPVPEGVDIKKRGVYALWLTDDAFLTLDLAPGRHGVAYAGVAGGSGGLRQRFSQEWRPEHSGRSTPRRTLGAVLWTELDLSPRARSDENPSKHDIEHYRFDEQGEARLSHWIDKHALFSYVVVEDEALEDETLISLERRLIQDLRPPLNLTRWSNPSGPRLRSLRTRAKEAAARWSG